jgi:hypothetical protein
MRETVDAARGSRRLGRRRAGARAIHVYSAPGVRATKRLYAHGPDRNALQSNGFRMRLHRALGTVQLSPYSSLPQHPALSTCAPARLVQVLPAVTASTTEDSVAFASRVASMISRDLGLAATKWATKDKAVHLQQVKAMGKRAWLQAHPRSLAM